MIAFLALVTGFSFSNTPADSIGKEMINGKVHVLHRVELKETLYGISKRYGTTVEAILQQNPTADGGLEVGVILKVPYVSAAKKSANGDKHIVAEKETMFSIARQYGLTVDELRQLNNIQGNAISTGQELIVKKSGSTITSTPIVKQSQPQQNVKGSHTVAEKETLYSIARQYGITVDQVKQWNNLTSNDLKLGQTLVISKPAAAGTITTTETTLITTVPDKPVVTEQSKPAVIETIKPAVAEPARPVTTIKITEGYKDGKEVVETGLAELIEGTQGNRKYLALHRTAPTGTILKVKNQMNDREVFVRVIGQLPDTGANDKLIIKISKSAYDRLSAIDPKFMVEVTWYK